MQAKKEKFDNCIMLALFPSFSVVMSLIFKNSAYSLGPIITHVALKICAPHSIPIISLCNYASLYFAKDNQAAMHLCNSFPGFQNSALCWCSDNVMKLRFDSVKL